MSREIVSSKLILPLIVLTALGLRLLHISFSVDNPFFYALSADELYYLEFAHDVIHGGLGLSSGLDFMDPLYGYLLGAMLWLTSENLFFVRLLQVGLDSLSVYLVYLISVDLFGRRAGLIAAAIYASCSAAIFYSALLLKTIWVANFCLLWVFFLIRSERGGIFLWLSIGAFVALCIMLRSNFLLLTPVTILWILWRNWKCKWGMATHLVAFAVGLILILSLNAWRHHMIMGTWQWLPSNGGILLYQVYNLDYFDAGRMMPNFVPTLNPRELQYYSIREAERRTGRTMSHDDVNAFFYQVALNYIRENPVQVLRHLSGNLVSFVSGHEVSNNRSYYIEQRYSSILQLPLLGYALLFGFGTIGLLTAMRQDARIVILWVPIAVALITYTVFFDFSRYRFPAVPMLAIGAGFLLDQLWKKTCEKRWKSSSATATLACFVILISTALGWGAEKETASDQQKLAAAQVRAGQLSQAEVTISAALKKMPDNANLYELLAIIAISRENYSDAIEFNQKAVSLDINRHVAWYNLSLAYGSIGEETKSIAAIRSAVAIRPLPEYRYRLAKLLEVNAPETSRNIYKILHDELEGSMPLREQVNIDLERLESVLMN